MGSFFCLPFGYWREKAVKNDMRSSLVVLRAAKEKQLEYAAELEREAEGYRERALEAYKRKDTTKALSLLREFLYCNDLRRRTMDQVQRMAARDAQIRSVHVSMTSMAAFRETADMLDRITTHVNPDRESRKNAKAEEKSANFDDVVDELEGEAEGLERSLVENSVDEDELVGVLKAWSQGKTHILPETLVEREDPKKNKQKPPAAVFARDDGSESESDSEHAEHSEEEIDGDANVTPPHQHQHSNGAAAAADGVYYPADPQAIAYAAAEVGSVTDGGGSVWSDEEDEDDGGGDPDADGAAITAAEFDTHHIAQQLTVAADAGNTEAGAMLRGALETA